MVITIGGVNVLSTSREAMRKVLAIIESHQLNKINFFDLGCGDGKIVLAVKKRFPNLNVSGIEKSCLLIFFSKIRALPFLLFKKKKISFKKGDLFAKNLKEADIIYCYLPRNLIADLEKKLKKELKNGAIVITNTTFFPNWQPKKVFVVHPKKPDFEKLFLYLKE